MRRVLLLFAVLPVLLYACVSTSPTPRATGGDGGDDREVRGSKAAH